jgi:hypothetical protein
MTPRQTTEELIRALSRRPAPPPFRPAAALGVMLVPGLAGLGLFLLAFGPRPDLAAAWQQLPVLAKSVLPALLALSAIWLALRSSWPGGRVALWPLAVPALAALALVLWRLTVTDAPLLAETLGQTALACLISITALSALPLVAGIMMLRRTAPTRPALTGALLGLAVGGGIAAGYALHCTEDSPLFFVTWYGLAIALVGAFGGWLGRRFLRW